MTNNVSFTKDVAAKKLFVIREYDAPVEKVWKAWTDSNLLDKWWGPRPWRAETKTMQFKEGGRWLYAMVGPDGTKAWCRVDFRAIVPQKSFATTAWFCDEEGKINNDFPTMKWLGGVVATANGTKLEVEISFDKEADLQRIVEMGFEAGFTMGLGQLGELLQASA